MSNEGTQLVSALQSELSGFLVFMIDPGPVLYETMDRVEADGYVRHLIEYKGSELDPIRAFLFVPDGQAVVGAVLVHHQHNGERHLGKSEVGGLIGDPYQAFGPALAKRGIIVLAPDSICFEDRRPNKQGCEPDEPDNDWLQHYNEMCYRLLHGDFLMRKVLADSAIGISLLSHHPRVDEQKIGILGHSYGGNTVLFHAPIDDRIQYACSSGALCSYLHKVKNGTGIEMAEVIPGFASRFDVHDLLKCMIPKKVLVLSAEEDPYSADARQVVAEVRDFWRRHGLEDVIEHHCHEGGHALDEQRFQLIVDWFHYHMLS